MKSNILCALVIVGTSVGVCSADLLIDDYASYKNDRYYVGANRAFIGDAFNLSGVGKDTTSPVTDDLSRWATLVSPHFALSAGHFAPTVGSTVTYVLGNSPSSPTVSGVVGANFAIGGSDLDLVEFTTAVTGPNLNYMPILNQNQAYIGQELYVYGQGNRLGTNQIFAYDPGQTVGGTNPGNAIIYDYNTTIPNEAKLESGDSGGPSFVVDSAGQLALVGVHWFNYDPGDLPGDPYGGSGDTYIPDYLSGPTGLVATIAAQDLLHGWSDTVTTVNAVPEPASLLLVSFGGVGMLAWARHRRRAAVAV